LWFISIGTFFLRPYHVPFVDGAPSFAPSFR